jgi:hypothetical protein
MRLEMRRLLASGLAGALAACGRGDDARAVGGDSAGLHMGMDSMPMQGMGKEAMGGMGDMVAMMSGMRGQMDTMMSMPPDRMKAMMATHDQMMAQMMDRMGADMRNMTWRDREWSALADSVRQDLAALPQLEGKRLPDRMRAHAERVNRLMAMHERMMSSMKKP